MAFESGRNVAHYNIIQNNINGAQNDEETILLNATFKLLGGSDLGPYNEERNPSRKSNAAGWYSRIILFLLVVCHELYRGVSKINHFP